MTKHPFYNLWLGASGEVRGPRGVRKVRLDRDGYERINVTHNAVHMTLLVHRLVAETFLGPREGRTVNHKDGNKRNNAVNNLEYLTAAENTTHAFQSGLVATCAPTLGYYSKREAARQTGIPRHRIT